MLVIKLKDSEIKIIKHALSLLKISLGVKIKSDDNFIVENSINALYNVESVEKLLNKRG